MPASSTPLLQTSRLTLTPIHPDDAREMVDVLGDPSLYVFTGGEALSYPQLEARYRAQVAGSPSDDQVWHNWVVRTSDEGVATGFVQATVTHSEADVAWVVGVPWQGSGIATEAATAICDWLFEVGVNRLLAHIHPDHVASARVAGNVGFVSTGEFDADGEVVWVRDHGP